MGHFVVVGHRIVSLRQPIFEASKIYKVQMGSVQYEVHVSVIRFISLTECKNLDQKTTLATKQFFFDLMESFLYQLNLRRLGSKCQFFNVSNKIKISNSLKAFIKGYRIKFKVLGDGLYQRVDLVRKFLHGVSILDLINEIYEKEENKLKSKEEKRSIVK